MMSMTVTLVIAIVKPLKLLKEFYSHRQKVMTRKIIGKSWTWNLTRLPPTLVLRLYAKNVQMVSALNPLKPGFKLHFFLKINGHP